MQKLKNELLVARAKKQDPDAFTELMQLYMQEMYKVGLSILMNDDDVADAVQETILNCWEKLSTLRKDEYFGTWMIRILMNNCYDILRQKKNVTDLAEWIEPSYEDRSNLELKEALSKLPEKYRLPITLFYCDDLSVNEIAKVLGSKPSTVRTQLQRGRQMLSDYYEVPKVQGKE